MKIFIYQYEYYMNNYILYENKYHFLFRELKKSMKLSNDITFFVIKIQLSALLAPPIYVLFKLVVHQYPGGERRGLSLFFQKYNDKLR